MGAIMVVGIVHKNGILMLDAEKHFTAEGLSLRDAIYQAGRRRLRPILMTALATIFGMLPLAIGVGSGAQLLQPLAIAVIGGVTVSMVLSLLITPVLFYLLRRARTLRRIRMHKTLALLLALGAHSLFTQAPAKTDRWIRLFDGKSLAGGILRTTPPGQRKRDLWSADKAATDGSVPTRPTAISVLKLEFRNSPGGNSGVFFRASKESKAGDPPNPADGYELQNQQRGPEVGYRQYRGRHSAHCTSKSSTQPVAFLCAGGPRRPYFGDAGWDERPGRA